MIRPAPRENIATLVSSCPRAVNTGVQVGRQSVRTPGRQVAAQATSKRQRGTRLVALVSAGDTDWTSLSRLATLRGRPVYSEVTDYTCAREQDKCPVLQRTSGLVPRCCGGVHRATARRRLRIETEPRWTGTRRDWTAMSSRRRPLSPSSLRRFLNSTDYES